MARVPASWTFTSGSQMRSSIVSFSVATCSMKEPIVQKRKAAGDGGARDIPPALMQCLSKSARDLVFSAARKPWVTAMIAWVSSDRSCSSARLAQTWVGTVQHIGVEGYGRQLNIGYVRRLPDMDLFQYSRLVLKCLFYIRASGCFFRESLTPLHPLPGPCGRTLCNHPIKFEVRCHLSISGCMYIFDSSLSSVQLYCTRLGNQFEVNTATSIGRNSFS